MAVDELWREERDGAEESKVCRMKECLHGWTEERLVHEFHSVLEVWDGVDSMQCLLFQLDAGWIVRFCVGGHGCARRPGSVADATSSLLCCAHP